jgi:hypothetical protein
MKYQLLLLLLTAGLLSPALYAQQQQPDKRSVQVVDTLTTLEKNNRYPVITKAEMDSLALAYNASHPVEKPLPVKEIVPEVPVYWIAAMIAAVLLVFVLLLSLFSQHKRTAKALASLNRQMSQLEHTAFTATQSTSGTDRPLKNRTNSKTIDNKGALEQLQKEVQSQELLLNEYRFIKQDYEIIKQQITDVYKVRNYPGYDKNKSEQEVLEGLLQTEKTVASYAYEHFLKPVINIADANKNNPSKISKDDRDKIVELLMSLSLLYSEYLYLRISELAIGGKIVERIAGLKNGNLIDKSLLKELNTEHGSRALVLRMVLDKKEIKTLSYPVFDETDLNLS